MAELKTYQDKRDLQRTQEPAGDKAAAAAGQRYAMHKHDASQLHYDLRLEQDGVLRSWALPKGPSLQVGEKRLAIEVEDHPLDYGNFEGVIPQGNYGGGTVMLWDRGQWSRGDDSDADKINFILHGEKLNGAWTLVRMAGKSDRNKNKGKNWLLIKRHDDEAQADASLDELDDRSVLSGRSMAAIAEQEQGADDDAAASKAKAGPLAPAAIDGSCRQKLPRSVRPQLATLVDEAPSSDAWLHEIKFDGYRLLARLDEGQVQLLTRNNKDWAADFPSIVAAMKHLPATTALLDGEAVLLDANGSNDFARLQEALSAENTGSVVYQAFDLLHLDGHDLTAVAQHKRKQVLAELLRSAQDDGKAGAIRYTDHFQGHGPAFYEQACEQGLEGIICKRADSAYANGRSHQWLKVKCSRDGEFVVIGFTDPQGERIGFGSLLLGAYDADRQLLYKGRVGTGFKQQQLRDLHGKLQRLERKSAPISASVPDARATHWVRPELVVEVRFSETTQDGRLRHPAFRGLRRDKSVADLQQTGEQSAMDKTQKTQGTGRNETARDDDDNHVAGVRLTHPQRVLYPEMGVTKRDLAAHFAAIQDWIIPELTDRPVSLLRCPDDWQTQCFFQKHPHEAIAGHVPRITITEKNGRGEYVYVRSIRDLVALVQAGTLELHIWGSRVDDLERPDRLVFDLDPDASVAWTEVVRVARELRDRLQDLGLVSFVRTTGGKGLHLVVPLTRRVEWDAAKVFAQAVAERHASDEPRFLTTNMAQDKRRGRIFIDYLRNARGATAIASYSTRARKGAPVAVPIRWDELGPQLHADHYHINNLRQRLAALKQDPWADFADAKRPLTQAMFQVLGLE